MLRNYYFTINIIIEKDDVGLEKTMNSIINQSLNFVDNTQIILFNKNYSNNWELVKNYLELYPKNIKIINQNDFSFNEILKNVQLLSKGQLISIIHSNDFFDGGALEIVLEEFLKETSNIISIHTPSINLLNTIKSDEDKIINIKNNFKEFNLLLNTFFVNKTFFNINFQEYSEEVLFILSLINDNGGFLFLRDAYVILKENSEKIFSLQTIENMLDIFSEKGDNNTLPYNIQYIIIYLLRNILTRNIFNSSDIKIISNILKNIDNGIILSNNLDKEILFYFLYIKNELENTKIISYENKMLLTLDDFILENLEDSLIKIDNINISKNQLNINFSMDSFFNECLKDSSVLLEINGELFTPTIQNSSKSDFISKYSKNYRFSTKIKEDNIQIKFLFKSELELYKTNISLENKNDLFSNSNNHIIIDDNKISISKIIIEENSNYENEVFTLWIGDNSSELPLLPYLSLKSMLLMGHDVILYTYSELTNVPKGVKVVDANTVLDKSKIFKYKKLHKTFAGFANWFRLERLYNQGGIWLDTDIILIKNVNDIVKEPIAICSEPNRYFYSQTNNAFLKFPKKDPLVKKMLEYAEDRGKDIEYAETGPHLVLKMLDDEFVEYHDYLKPYSLNNMFGWYDLEKYLLSPDYVLHNKNIDEIMGFHFVNTFFAEKGFYDKPSGFYKIIMDAILNSTSKKEYLSNLEKNGLFSESIKSTSVWDQKNLENISNKDKEFTYLIDSTVISKIGLYNILSSIERFSKSSFEIIICGLNSVSLEDIRYKDNILFLSSEFDKIKNELYEKCNGRKIIPINKAIFFKENFENEFNINDSFTYIVFNQNDNGYLNVIPKNDFKRFIQLNLDIFNLNKNYLIKNVIPVQYLLSNRIYLSNEQLTLYEKQVIHLINYIEENDLGNYKFKNIKNKINKLYDTSMINRLSYYYLTKLRNILSSNSYPEYKKMEENVSLNYLLSFASRELTYYKNKYPFDDFLLNLFKIYLTARIDIKNYGNSKNKVELINISDENSKMMYPDWMKNDKGNGMVIRSSSLSLDFSFRCISSGDIVIELRGPDYRAPNGKKIPINIDYKEMKINNKIIFKDSKVQWHDNPYTFKKIVKDEEVINVHLEWMPLNNSSNYLG